MNRTLRKILTFGFGLVVTLVAIAGRAEAKRLGTEQTFNDNVGSTGRIAVLDGRTKEVTASIHGSRDFDEYRAAIDARLQRLPGMAP